MRSKMIIAMVLGLGMAAAVPAFAQQGGGPGGGGPGGGRGNWDPAQMRQRMEERMKETLGVNDEEWKALQPKLEKVQTLQMQSRMGGFGGFGGRQRGGQGGPGGGAGAGPWGDMANSPVATASRELRETLDNKDSTAEQIKVKLTALRDAKAKAREELTAAQNELKELLTARQEAALVAQGTLD